MNPRRCVSRRAPGFSLVELLVALSIGLVLVIGMSSVYMFTKNAFNRQSQLSSLQQSVRTAFEYLGTDARMVGHLGCFTGSAQTSTSYNNALSVSGLGTNYNLGVEGFQYTGTNDGDAYTLGSDSPTNVTGGTQFNTNAAAGGITKAAMETALSAGRTPAGLTPGSDVLVIRTVAGPPVRLTADVAAAATTMSIENFASGKCSNGSTSKVSGFCASSHALIASCTKARVFAVTSITGAVLTVPGVAIGPFTQAGSEVFPLQTVAYYVAKSSSGTTTSLYRRVFNGDPAAGAEQELVEDVESLQVRYAVDTTPEPDGIVDEYDAADTVPDWGKVVAVRMSLLLRSPKTEGADVKVAASAPVNGLTITYPSGSKYDRRVFTTTVAVRNKISYFPP